jgi:hypothetical protein
VSFELTSRAGRLTLSAEDLVGMALEHTHFEPVAVFAPDHASQLATGKEAELTLQETREAT